MFGILVILGAIYILAKISSPSFWPGWRPPRRIKRRLKRGEKPYGLPWMGGTTEKPTEKYFWDD